MSADTQPEPSDPTQCSGDEGSCPEHGFHRHSLKRPGPVDDGRPIRKGLLPCIPPPEWEFHTVYGARTGSDGCALFPGDTGPVVVRRRVTYGDWEPVRPDRWAPEPPSEALNAARSAPQPSGGGEAGRDGDTGAREASGGSLREQLVAAIDNYPVACWTPGNLADRVLAVILPHGKFLGDQLRDAEQRLAETRTALDEVLRHFTHKGHPGEPCLSSGWISETTVARWRAVLYPPQPAPDSDGPSVREAAANDRRWPLQKHGE